MKTKTPEKDKYNSARIRTNRIRKILAKYLD
jgi:hypothetical protein